MEWGFEALQPYQIFKHMYKIGEKLKVHVLKVSNWTELNKGYAYGEVFGGIQNSHRSHWIKVELGEGQYTIANIKNSDLAELNQ